MMKKQRQSAFGSAESFPDSPTRQWSSVAKSSSSSENVVSAELFTRFPSGLEERAS
jgi:hypothetical protein